MMKFYSAFVSLFIFATPAFAYIGPGAGLGAIGVLIAVVGGILLLLVGFLWYPLKRMMRARQKTQTTDTNTESE